MAEGPKQLLKKKISVISLGYNKSKDFKKLHGFDENYFLYFEDVDICYRANKIGFKVGEVNNPKIQVIHFAQRKSLKNIKYYIMYLKSYFKIFKKTLRITT